MPQYKTIGSSTPDSQYRIALPATCSTNSSRSVEKKRSAIMPTKNGAIIAAIAAVPNAAPMNWSEKMRAPVASLAVDRYVLSVTNQAPHTKYCRNIITERRVRTSMGLAWGWSVFGGWPYDNARGGEWEIGRGLEFLIDADDAVPLDPVLPS